MCHLCKKKKYLKDAAIVGEMSWSDLVIERKATKPDMAIPGGKKTKLRHDGFIIEPERGSSIKNHENSPPLFRLLDFCMEMSRSMESTIFFQIRTTGPLIL